MKKIFAALCALLLVPTMASANSDLVSIAELHRQTVERGRWTKTYDTPNGELNVDIPILVPDVEKCPVITVENDRPFTPEIADVMLKNAFERNGMTWFRYDMNSQPFDVSWGTLGMGMTTDYESAKEFGMNTGEWLGEKWSNYDAKPNDYRYPWELDMNSSYIRGGTQTVAEAMACFQHVIDEAYPNKGYMIAPKRIAIHGSTAIDGENNGGKGYYTIRAEQVVNGIPMIGALCSTLGDNSFRVAYGSTPETDRIANRLAPYSLGSNWRTDVYLKMYTSSNTDYSVYVSMNRIRTVEQEDVPLAPLDRVLESIEKEITTGRIRNIHALRLGYMRYSNPEMEDYAWAVPMWVLDCDYVPNVSERLSLTLRGQVNGRIGTASTQAVTEESIPLLIQGVLESAALIETDEQDAILPPDDSYSSVCNASQAVTAITAEQKIALARDIDAKLRSDDPRLTPDTCAVATGEETFTLKNTLGLDLSHHSNMIYAMADVVARDGEHAATNYEIRWGYGLDAIDAEELAESCKREALLKLEAGRMKSGAYPVVIKNTAMANLLATFCGVFSADNAQKGLSLLAGREGEAVASASVTLTDDPLMPMGLASCPFDREGAATKTKAVIEDGVLKTLLHNRKTAKKAGCRTTGNAAGAGHVAPTNLFFKPGKLTQEELLANLGDGLYLTEVSGLHAGANPISGDFSLLSRGFEIKGGRVVRAVEEFTVAGNFYQLLKDITDVGGDLLFEASPIGSPSVLVKRLDVAGA